MNTHGFVADSTGVVLDEKALLVGHLLVCLESTLARHLQAVVAFVLAVHLGSEVAERRSGQFVFLVQDVEHARALRFYQVCREQQRVCYATLTKKRKTKECKEKQNKEKRKKKGKEEQRTTQTEKNKKTKKNGKEQRRK